jgi:hypothetical protein
MCRLNGALCLDGTQAGYSGDDLPRGRVIDLDLLAAIGRDPVTVDVGKGPEKAFIV